MRIISITGDNIGQEHICCAIGNDRENRARAQTKKEWLKGQFAQGLVFKRLDARGKAFIEYMPIEKVWKPLVGTNYLVINCFWVSGQFKGKGYSVQLLDECVRDAQDGGMDGIAVVSGANKEGFSFIYSNQCPFMEEYVRLLARLAREKGFHCQTIRLRDCAEAREIGSPFGTLGIYYGGAFLTHELMPEAKFRKLLEGVGAPERGSEAPEVLRAGEASGPRAEALPDRELLGRPRRDEGSQYRENGAYAGDDQEP